MTTLDELLDEWTLKKSTAGDEAAHTACAMSLLNYWKHGELTDMLSCGHPLILHNVITAFDHSATTHEQMVAITRAGEHGAVDTWWVPTEVVVAALAWTEEDDDPRSKAERVLDMLGASEGDAVSFARTAHGIMVSVSDEEGEKLREMAADVMKRRRKALKVLAQ